MKLAGMPASGWLILLRQHDGQNASGLRRIGRIIRAKIQRLIEIVDLPKHALVRNLYGAEVVLVIRIVIGAEAGEALNGGDCSGREGRAHIAVLDSSLGTHAGYLPGPLLWRGAGGRHGRIAKFWYERSDFIVAYELPKIVTLIAVSLAEGPRGNQNCVEVGTAELC